MKRNIKIISKDTQKHKDYKQKDTELMPRTSFGSAESPTKRRRRSLSRVSKGNMSENNCSQITIDLTSGSLSENNFIENTIDLTSEERASQNSDAHDVAKPSHAAVTGTNATKDVSGKISQSNDQSDKAQAEKLEEEFYTKIRQSEFWTEKKLRKYPLKEHYKDITDAILLAQSQRRKSQRRDRNDKVIKRCLRNKLRERFFLEKQDNGEYLYMSTYNKPKEGEFKPCVPWEDLFSTIYRTVVKDGDEHNNKRLKCAISDKYSNIPGDMVVWYCRNICHLCRQGIAQSSRKQSSKTQEKQDFINSFFDGKMASSLLHPPSNNLLGKKGGCSTNIGGEREKIPSVCNLKNTEDRFTGTILLHFNTTEQTRQQTNQTISLKSGTKYIIENESVCVSTLKKMLEEETSFINDEVMNVTRKILNDRNIKRIKSCKWYTRCYIIGAFFMTSLIGQNSNQEKNKVLFEKYPRNCSKKTGIKNWADELYEFSCSTNPHTIRSLVGENKLDKLVVQVNIMDHHWFAVEVCFKHSLIIAHCSTMKGMLSSSTTNNCNPTISKQEDNRILTYIRGKTGVKLQQKIATLRDLCERNGIKKTNVSNYITAIRRLFRPMAVQEMYHFLIKENVIDSKCDNWILLISSSMPQQRNTGNNCALYTTTISDVLSSGGCTSTFNQEIQENLEKNGRLNLTHLICHKFCNLTHHKN